MNPLDAICNRQRNEAICVSQLKNARNIDPGILQERPDVKIFLPFRFFVYRPEMLFQPNTYNKYLGEHFRPLKVRFIFYSFKLHHYNSFITLLNSFNLFWQWPRLETTWSVWLMRSRTCLLLPPWSVSTMISTLSNSATETIDQRIADKIVCAPTKLIYRWTLLSKLYL